jgi:glycerophosphoryl diester phosphodiesterase
LTSVIAVLTNWEEIDSFLEYFGLGIAGVVLYFLEKLFLDKRIDQAISWSLDKSGLKQQPTKSIEVSTNPRRYERLLEGLRDKVQNLCQSNINRIIDGELELIEDLNWRIQSKSNITSYRGQLSEAVRNIQGDKLLSLAVVGEAGVGKTSAIYSFILDWVLNEPNDLVPVYFSLSSWKRNQNLEQWLIEELSRLYHLDKRAAQYFIEDFHIYPFLDGLDQMTQEMREKCIHQVFEYSKNNPIGLSSRPPVYKELIKYLNDDGIATEYLFDVFELLPLTSEQVSEITGRMKTKDAFKEVITKSEKIKVFSRFPMVLFILANVIDELTENDIEVINQSSDSRVFQLLWKKYDHYIFADKHFLSQRNIQLNPGKIRNWLKRISHQQDSSFYIEELQPFFLSGKVARNQYYFVSRVTQCIFIAIAAGLFMAGPFDLVSSGILSGFVAFIIVLASGVTDANIEEKPPIAGVSKPVAYLRGILLHIIPLLIILCLYFGFSVPRNPEFSGEMQFGGTFAMTEVNVGFLIAVLMALILGNRYSWQHRDFDIRLVERISRDWRKFFKYGFAGGVCLGVFLIPVAFLITYFFSNTGFGSWLASQQYVSGTYTMAFLVGLIFGFCLFGIIGYLKEQSILMDKEEKKRIFTPNYGIQQTFLNAIKAGLFVTVVLALLYGSFILILEGEVTSLIKALNTSLAFGVLGFLWFGGLDVIGHYCLRLVIYLDNSGPLNYIHFLEQASSLRFIRINGSGYEFTHPTIKEYFLKTEFPGIGQSNTKKRFVPILVVIALFSILYGLYDRFYGDSYWESALSGLVVESHSPYVKEINHPNTKLVVQGLDSSNTIMLRLDATGRVKVGTFTGYVDAGGTEGGFFGMGIKDTYDRQPELQHGVLAVKKTNESQWRGFPDTDFYDLFSNSKKLFLRVDHQDSLEFLVNDNEYHNNKGRFILSIDTVQNKGDQQIISHRGAAGLAPENTLASIRKSMELKVDKIEIDVNLTKDGHLVVIHDIKINRTTNGKGKVADMSLEEIQQYYIDDTPGHENLRIPTLAEVFTLLDGGKEKLLIEIKSPKSYENIDIILYDLIEQFSMQDRVEVFSFDKDFCINFKKAHPHIFVGQFLVSPYGTSKIEGVDAVGIYYHSLLFRKSFMEEMREKDLKVYAWSVNTQRGMQRLIDLDIDGIITDRPDLMKRTLGY